MAHSAEMTKWLKANDPVLPDNTVVNNVTILMKLMEEEPRTAIGDLMVAHRNSAVEQALIEIWCWENLPKLIRDCTTPPPEDGSSLLGEIKLSKMADFKFMMMLSGVNDEDDITTTLSFSGAWLDCQGLWEHINKRAYDASN